MTKKLFYTNPDIMEWKTKITSSKYENGKWVITLQETAFYPEGGGQPCDTGKIAGIPVENVYKDHDEVYHILPMKPEQEEVSCAIDAKRRLVHTQHHSGQHLLSATCLDLYGFETLSFHLSDETATIDLDVEALTEEELIMIESEVNRRIFANIPVRTFYIDSRDAKKYALRKIPEGHEKLRIVEIAGIEYNACAGTHVRSTAQIGPLKLLKQEKVRGKTRLYFVCGQRLLEDYSRHFSITNALATQLTTSVSQLSDQVKRLLVENKTLKKNYSRLFNQYAELLKSELLSKSRKAVIDQTFTDLSMKELEILAAKLHQETDRIILFGSVTEGKILLSHNGKSRIHCGQIVKVHLDQFNAKGGGNERKAQAVFQDAQDLRSFVKIIRDKILEILQTD